MVSTMPWPVRLVAMLKAVWDTPVSSLLLAKKSKVTFRKRKVSGVLSMITYTHYLYSAS